MPTSLPPNVALERERQQRFRTGSSQINVAHVRVLSRLGDEHCLDAHAACAIEAVAKAKQLTPAVEMGA